MIRPLVELRIAQHDVVAAQRRRLRRSLRLLFHQGVQTGHAEIRVRRIPLRQLRLLRCTEQRQQRHLRLRRRHDTLEQGRKVCRQPVQGRRIEQRCAVTPGQLQARLAFLQAQFQIELADLVGQRRRLQHHPIQIQLHHLRVLHDHQHLEQRAVGQAAFRSQCFHQHLERHVLMRVRVQNHRLVACQQRLERVSPRQVRAQHQAVDEQANQSFRVLVHATRDRRAHDHIGRISVATQQHGQRRLQQHEQRHVLAMAQLTQRRDTFRWQPLHLRRPRKALLRRPRPIQRQAVHRRQVSQLLFPVIQFARQPLALQPTALPLRIVHVLQRQRRQRILRARTIGPVQRSELLHQHADRPAVCGYVVQSEHDHVLGLGKPDQAHSQLERLAQHKRRPCLLAHQPLHFRGSCLRVPPAQIDLAQRQFRRLHHLTGLPVRRHQTRTQHLVSRHDALHRSRERRAIQLAFQRKRTRHVVVHAAAFQRIDEPQPFLAVGQRHRRASIGRLDRRQQQAGHHGLQRIRHAAHGRMLEYHPQRQLDHERLAHRADQPRRQQRMPAQRKKIVVDADSIDAEQVLPQRTQLRFGRRARRHIGRPRPVGIDRRRQRLAVQLAVRCQRHPIQSQIRGRHHVLRQLCRDMTPQCLHRHLSIGDVIRHQELLAGGILPRQHHRLTHVRERGQP